MTHKSDYSIVDGRHGTTGRELRAWRESRGEGRGMTQAEAGALFGLTGEYWGMMERGERAVSKVLAALIRQWQQGAL